MRRRRSTIPPITRETTLDNASKWLRIVRYGESGTVVQLQDDCEYRVLEVIEDPALTRSFLGPYYRKYLLAYIPVDQRDIMTVIHAALCQLLARRDIDLGVDPSSLDTSAMIALISEKGYEIGLFLSHLTPLLTGEQIQPLIDLEFLIRTKKNLSVIVFSERDIAHPQYSYLADKCSFLFDHVLYYPLYDVPDALQFISFYCQEWEMTIPHDVIRRMIVDCGGYLWLLHQGVRTFRDNSDMRLTDVFTHPLMLWKLESIWGKFSAQEQEIMRRTMQGTLEQDDVESHAFRYLVSIRMIRMDKGKPMTGIPILRHVLERQKHLRSIRLEQNRLFLNGIDCTDKFSRSEKNLLTVLLSKQKQVVSRDIVAQCLWGDASEQRYSDWAIDRLVSRLRKTCSRVGVDPALLRTVKRKGFIFG